MSTSNRCMSTQMVVLRENIRYTCTHTHTHAYTHSHTNAHTYMYIRSLSSFHIQSVAMHIQGINYATSGLDCNKSKNRFANIFPCENTHHITIFTSILASNYIHVLVLLLSTDKHYLELRDFLYCTLSKLSICSIVG